MGLQLPVPERWTNGKTVKIVYWSDELSTYVYFYADTAPVIKPHNGIFAMYHVGTSGWDKYASSSATWGVGSSATTNGQYAIAAATISEVSSKIYYTNADLYDENGSIVCSKKMDISTVFSYASYFKIGTDYPYLDGIVPADKYTNIQPYPERSWRINQNVDDGYPYLDGIVPADKYTNIQPYPERSWRINQNVDDGYPYLAYLYTFTIPDNKYLDGHGLVTLWQKILSTIDTHKIKLILKSEEWDGDAAPFLYILSNDKLKATTTSILSANDTATDTQFNSFKSADICRIVTSDKSAILYAYGTKPTIDIPVEMLLHG